VDLSQLFMTVTLKIRWKNLRKKLTPIQTDLGPVPPRDENPGERAPASPIAHPDEDDNPHYSIHQYPPSALEHPFPTSSPLLVTNIDDLVTHATYILFKKDNVLRPDHDST